MAKKSAPRSTKKPQSTKKQPDVAHPGMMGDGTEEQNLDERGNPGARIKKDEVDAAFGSKSLTSVNRGVTLMTDKSNFTPDEWKLLLQSVVAAGIAVTAADPSGLWGLLKESFAGGTVLAKAKMDPGTNALIKAVVADFSTAEGSAARDGLKNTFKGSKPAEIKDKCIEILRQTAAIVDVKAPGDAAALKGWLQQISQHVAEAAKESGFLGIGGVPVSDAEKATLTEISSALKSAA